MCNNDYFAYFPAWPFSPAQDRSAGGGMGDDPANSGQENRGSIFRHRAVQEGVALQDGENEQLKFGETYQNLFEFEINKLLVYCFLQYYLFLFSFYFSHEGC